MSDGILSRLFSTMSVQVHAFALCDIQAGWELAKEGTPDALYVHYVLRGSGEIAVGDQPAIAFGPNSMVIPPPGAPHRIGHADAVHTAAVTDARSTLPNGIVKITAGDGSSDIQLACGVIRADYAGALGLFDRLPDALVEDLSASARLRHAFAFMVEELAQPDVGTQDVTEALMKQCLLVLLRVHLRERGTRSPIFEALRDPRLVPAVASVLDAPGAGHTVDSLACLCGMSRTVFAERFSEIFGEGPIEFLHRARLRLAARLLTTSPMPVKVIAASVGYASRSYFSHAFKAAYGSDPSAYRSRLANTARATEPVPDALFDATLPDGERDQVAILEKRHAVNP
jgi:AraC-like DNA-binding protein